MQRAVCTYSSMAGSGGVSKSHGCCILSLSPTHCSRAKIKFFSSFNYTKAREKCSPAIPPSTTPSLMSSMNKTFFVVEKRKINFTTTTTMLIHVIKIHQSLLLLQSGLFIWVCRNISTLVGCIKKLRALYEVQLLETFQIQPLDLALNSTRKKLQRPKIKKSQTAPWKWHFSPHDFLGLQQSLCKY